MMSTTSTLDHSLDASVHEGSRESVADTVGGEDRDLALADHGIVMEGWLAELPERDREMLRLRFEKDLTQREIAGQFGIS